MSPSVSLMCPSVSVLPRLCGAPNTSLHHEIQSNLFEIDYDFFFLATQPRGLRPKRAPQKLQEEAHKVGCGKSGILRDRSLGSRGTFGIANQLRSPLLSTDYETKTSIKPIRPFVFHHQSITKRKLLYFIKIKDLTPEGTKEAIGVSLFCSIVIQ